MNRGIGGGGVNSIRTGYIVSIYMFNKITRCKVVVLEIPDVVRVTSPKKMLGVVISHKFTTFDVGTRTSARQRRHNIAGASMHCIYAVRINRME